MTKSIEENEIEWHRQIAEEARQTLSPVRPEVVERYTKTKNWRVIGKEFIFKNLRELSEKYRPEVMTVADFGCGDGINSCEAAKIVDNAKFIGFDLSPDLIEVAKERAKLDNLSEKTQFFVANAEAKDPLGANTQVDVMMCLNILHHVQLDQVVPNLMKTTKPGGVFIIREPIAFSEKLQKIRDASGVPKNVTPDERQLSKDEIDYILSLMVNPKIKYSKLLSRLTRLLPNVHNADAGISLTKIIILFLHWLDYLLLSIIPPLKKYCGEVVIIGERPFEK